MHKALLAAAILATSPLLAHAYTFTDITPPGSTIAGASGISGSDVVGFTNANGSSDAWYWTAGAPGTDLAPAGVDSSALNAAVPGMQVGTVTSGALTHAALWTGTSASYQPLNETGYASGTVATAIHGGIIAGYGTNTNDQAVIWSNPTNNAVAPIALTTPGTYNTFSYISSRAASLDGTHAAGFATLSDTDGSLHAVIWNISNLASPTFFDIHPATGYDNSQATGVSGNLVVGFATDQTSGFPHALLWTLTGDSVDSPVDLNPAGYQSSVATATNGTDEVGYGTDAGGNLHALLWEGTAGSVVDLGALVPGTYTGGSLASGIDAFGNVSGTAIVINDDLSTSTFAVVWTPDVPEPASAALLLLGAAPLLRRRRRR